MRYSSKAIIGVFCISTGMSTVLSTFLPNWVWSLIVSFVLIVCGVLFFYNY